MSSLTERALAALAHGVKADVESLVRDLESARAKMQRLATARGLNGTTGFFRSGSAQLEELIGNCRETASRKAAELRGEAPKPPMTERTDEAQLEAVREARSAA